MEKSLWVVMDPWLVEPGTKRQDCINFLNDVFGQKISHYLFNVKHKCYSMVEEYEPMLYFSTWVNLSNEVAIQDYMKDNDLSKITYCGFHHGFCIIENDTGAMTMSKYYDCYLKHDLSCPTSSSLQKMKINFKIHDRESAKHMTFV